VSYNFEYREEDALLYRPAAESELQLMMEGREGDPILREDTALGDSLWAVFEEHLTEREQWVLRAFLFERQSIRSIGRELNLSKSQVQRVKDAALAKLRVHLVDCPPVQSYLERS
jgi:DNA-directed RNA polymerase specialized sigma subunit